MRGCLRERRRVTYWLVEFLPADVEERGAFDGIPRSAPGVSREFVGAHG